MVRLGDQNLLSTNEGAEPVDYNIRLIIVHPKYEKKFKRNDIALIKLWSIVTFTNFIRPACLYQHETYRGNVIAVLMTIL